jgi:hypothetical protein
LDGSAKSRADEIVRITPLVDFVMLGLFVGGFAAVWGAERVGNPT